MPVSWYGVAEEDEPWRLGCWLLGGQLFIIKLKSKTALHTLKNDCEAKWT